MPEVKIQSKIADRGVITPEVASPVPVVDLMEALRKSLGAVTTTKKKPAKAQLRTVKAKPVTARKRRAS